MLEHVRATTVASGIIFSGTWPAGCLRANPYVAVEGLHSLVVAGQYLLCPGTTRQPDNTRRHEVAWDE